MQDLHELPKLRDSLSYLYVEHAMLDKKQQAVEYVQKDGRTLIPIANLSVLMLGPGTSITHAAINTLARSGCTILWTGEDATRFYAQGIGETRKGRRLLRQAELVSQPQLRQQVVINMYRHRFNYELSATLNLNQIRGKEGVRVREAYAQASRDYNVPWNGRKYDRGSWGSTDPINRALSAANALLKILEEPPAECHFFLISHQPGRLLPTIRSRCRQLHLAPLSASDMAQAMAAAGIEKSGSAALAALAGGSVGAAIRLKNLDGLHAYAAIVALFSTLPRLDRPQALKLAESVSGRGQEPRFDLLTMLMDMFLARLARSGVMGPPELEAAPGEAALMARLSPDAVAARCWADLHQGLGARSRHGKAVNIDPAALLLDMILKIDESASQLAKRLESSS